MRDVGVDRRLALVAVIATVLVAVGFGFGVAGTAAADETGDATLETTLEDDGVTPGEEVNVSVTATVPEDEISDYEIDVVTSDPAVAEITALEPVGEPVSENTSIEADGSHAVVQADYGSDADTDGTTTVATVTLEATATGETTVWAQGDLSNSTEEWNDVQVDEPSILSVDEPAPDPNWEANPGAIEESELYAAHDAVYPVTRAETDDGESEYTLSALESSDGSERWSETSDEMIRVVGVDEYVVASVGDGTDSDLVAFDPETGEEVWSYTADSSFDFHATTVNADDGELYAATGDRVVILNASTGEKLGAVEDVEPSQFDWTDEAIYAVTDTEIHALERDGTEFWSETLPEESDWNLEYGPDETVLVWNDTDAVVYDANTDPVDQREHGTYTADGTIDDVAAGDRQYLVAEGEVDEDATTLRQLHVDGTTDWVHHLAGSTAEFYDGEHGLYLLGDELVRLERDGHVEWTASESIQSRTVTEIDDQLVGVVDDDGDRQTVIGFDYETGDTAPVYETDDSITWSAADAEQLYVAGTTTVAATDPADIETVTISGTVTDPDGNALAGDELWVFDRVHSTSDDVQTHDDGTYSITVEANETYYPTYYRYGAEPGFEPDRNGIADIHLFEPIEVESDDVTANLTVPEGHPVTVDVTDEDGDPVENASGNVHDVRHFDENGSMGVGAGQYSTTADGHLQHPNADEPGLELAGDARVFVEPPEDDDRFLEREYEAGLTVNERTTHTVELAETELPPVTGDEPPRDLTGDGRYEDVTGSGSLTVDDVQTLFDNRDEEAIEDHANAYDFSGHDDDEVTVADVQALWDRLEKQRQG